MKDLIENSIRLQICKDVDGTIFYSHMAGNRRDTDELVKEIKEVLKKHNLSASETKGFLEYMKIIVDVNSYLPQMK